MALISKKKIIYSISSGLRQFLIKYSRELNIPIHYHELLRYTSSVALFDSKDQDTLWETVFYDQSDRKEIHLNVKKIYALLKAGGDMSVMDHLYVDRIDLCIYGNTQPFRIRIVNRINDNFDYFYIKNADASRVYGLELEHLLSPNRISYFVHMTTLIEEHIAGIPGEMFMKNYMDDPNLNPIRIAKEFVKFNERCMIRLLGDMRAYNYVIVPIHDFDQVVYKIRPIDFDQQCYEGNLKVYRPQFFKENYPMVKLVKDKLENSSIEQYKNEERAALAKRIFSSETRVNKLLQIMGNDNIAPDSHVEQLKLELYRLTHDINFKRAKSMGNVLDSAFDFITRNYKNVYIVS